MKANRDGISLRRGRFQISWVDSRGIRHREMTHAKNVQEARQLRSEKLRKAEQAKFLGVVPPADMDFQTLAAEYLEHQRAVITAGSLQAESNIVRLHLNPYFSGPIADIRLDRVQNYVTRRSADKVSPYTLRMEIHVLKHVFKYAIDREYLPTNPAERVKGPKAPAGRCRYLQIEEIPKLIDACPAWLKPIVAFALVTGMRISEIRGLRWLDVDLVNGVATLPKTKNGTSRIVPLCAPALMVLDSLTGERKPSKLVFACGERNRASIAFKRASLKAGIPDMRFHDLRHSFASHFMMSGGDQFTLSKIVGHKSLSMTARYSHLSPQFLKGEVSRLDGAFSGVLNGADGVPIDAPNLLQAATTCTKGRVN